MALNGISMTKAGSISHPFKHYFLVKVSAYTKLKNIRAYELALLFARSPQEAPCMPAVGVPNRPRRLLPAGGPYFVRESPAGIV